MHGLKLVVKLCYANTYYLKFERIFAMQRKMHCTKTSRQYRRLWMILTFYARTKSDQQIQVTEDDFTIDQLVIVHLTQQFDGTQTTLVVSKHVRL